MRWYRILFYVWNRCRILKLQGYNNRSYRSVTSSCTTLVIIIEDALKWRSSSRRVYVINYVIHKFKKVFVSLTAPDDETLRQLQTTAANRLNCTFNITVYLLYHRSSYRDCGIKHNKVHTPSRLISGRMSSQS